MRVILPSVLLCVLLVAGGSRASGQTAPDAAGLVGSAEVVVVAEIEELRARFERNRHGDQLIVSDVYARVQESLRGSHVSALIVTTIEGGTIGDLTLRVSDLPQLTPGDRAVMLLDSAGPGRFAVRGRGRGLLRLKGERIEGSALTLADVRRAARGARR